MRMHISKRRSRAIVFGLAVGAVSAVFVTFGGCANNSSPGADNGIGTAGQTCVGCPCEPGTVTECHKTLSANANALLCEIGTETCDNGAWSECKGTRQVLMGAGASFERGLHTLDLAGADAAAGCSNPCSPSCSVFQDNAVNLDAGSTGLTLTEGGGLTLLGEAGIGCYGFACQVNHNCPLGAKTTITGKVYDPAGQNPLPNVYVYVPNGVPDPFTPGVAADVCGGGGTLTGDPLPFPVQTDVNGSFTLQDVPTGTNIPVILQIGRWRRQITIPNVTACVSQTIPNLDGLGAGKTRLAKKQNEGSPYDTVPQIAVVAGGADGLQYFINRIGVDSSEFTTEAGSGRVHFYRTPSGGTLSGYSASRYDVLLGSPSQLAKYDMVFLSCDGGSEWNSGSAVNQPLQNIGAGSLATHEQAHTNLRNYASIGGRIFATHYGREWIHQTPNAAFPGVANWGIDGYEAVSLDAVTTFPKGIQFRDWMVGTGRSFPFTPSQPRRDLAGVIYPTTAWLVGSYGGLPFNSNFTFNTPLGPADGAAPPGGFVGKVTYSDIHVTFGGGTFPGSTPGGNLNNDESALEYLVFDLSSCVSSYTGPLAYPGPATFTRVYESPCPAGTQVRWRLFSWRGATPGGSSIQFKVGTASTVAAISTTTFVNLLASNWTTATPVVSPNWATADAYTALNSAGQLSKQFLAVKMTLYPNAAGNQTPTLYQWQQDFECLEAQ